MHSCQRVAMVMMAIITAVAPGCRLPVTTSTSQADCERNSLASVHALVEEGRVVEDSALFNRVDDDMSLSALVKALGPASRDIGSGLHLFVWQARDGSMLRAGAGGLCDRVLNFEWIRR